MTKSTPEGGRSISTIVVSRPGIMQQSLRASLAAFPWVTVVASAGDGLTALGQVTQHHPGLVIIDSNLLDEEVAALLDTVKIRYPETHCLVMIRSSQRVAQLLSQGADAVALRDGTLHQLQVALQPFASDA